MSANSSGRPLLGVWLQCLLLALLSAAWAAAGAEPLKVIFDTDIDGDNDDVAAAYFASAKQRSDKADYKRHCADPVTVLYAVTGTQYFGEVGPGACDVREDGHTRWNAQRDKQHFYNTQKLPVRELEQVMEELLVKPPKRAAISP